MSENRKPGGTVDTATADVSPQPARPPISRREFARRAAMASAISPLAAFSASSTPSSAPPATRVTPPPAQAAPEAASLSPASQAEADARAQSILAQYASRFSDAQQADIRRLAALAQPPLEREKKPAGPTKSAPPKSAPKSQPPAKKP